MTLGTAPSGSKRQSRYAWLLASLLFMAILSAAFIFTRSERPAKQSVFSVEDSPATASLRRGLELYQSQCAPCHGERGFGDGPAAYLLYPKPRDFSSGTFRLTSTESGLPSDEDLLSTLKRGMPGSAMPPWGHLPQDDLRALVEAVRFIAIEGKAQQLVQSGAMPREAAVKLAHDILDPGERVAVPPKPDPAALAQERGRELYLSSCASCHDQDGRGRRKQDMEDETGYPIFARDFTQGIFKGGSDGDLLALRITRGLPGSPMPGTAFTPSDLWSLVEYLQTLVTPGAQERLQQVQTVLTASRIRGSIPVEPLDTQWTVARETFFPVMPLWWRGERIEGVAVSALHNDAQIALRLQWDDATPDTHQLTQSAFGDGVAIQLSPHADPPSFTMGAESDEVSIWYWRASLDTSAGGPTALADVHPHMPSADEDAYVGHPTDEVFMTATAVGNPVSQPQAAVQSLRAGGFGTLTAHHALSNPVSGQARRVGQSWQVVFLRDLADDGDIRFKAGDTVSIAFAVWDGSAGDRNGQKSVTIWHRLCLEK